MDIVFMKLFREEWREISMHVRGVCAALAFLAAASAASAQPEQPSKPKAVFEKTCSGCHALDIVVASRRSRDQWQDTIQAMITKQGAKITDEESSMILDYLVAEYGRGTLDAQPGRGTASPVPAGGRGGRGPNMMGAGADDKHVVDPLSADRGRKVYAAECINCHGTHARGSDNGADLIRSVVVLHDRYGNEIGPYLRKGHPTQTTPAARLTQSQIEDLSHFVHYEVYQTLRSELDVQNVLTGDAKAGAAYFSGAGKCSTCHSATGDLAGIARRYSPVNLQQRFLFPQGGRGGRGGRAGRAVPPANPITVTVTPASGPAITGSLVELDDFNVSLRDASGEYHSWKRTPSLKVVKHDPFVAHEELLDRITDKNIHDVVAYLETLQ
jgi:cytochrome c oxidase cbb3-type subunit 3